MSQAIHGGEIGAREHEVDELGQTLRSTVTTMGNHVAGAAHRDVTPSPSPVAATPQRSGYQARRGGVTVGSQPTASGTTILVPLPVHTVQSLLHPFRYQARRGGVTVGSQPTASGTTILVPLPVHTVQSLLHPHPTPPQQVS